jgi:hypothetical protein
MSKSELQVELFVSGNVNGSSFEVHGFSHGVPGSGNIRADVDLGGSLPHGFQLPILSYVLLTGQPSMSFVTRGASNPFVSTAGVYKAVRTLQIDDETSFTTSYDVTKKGNQLEAHFSITGISKLPALKSIKPTIETWTPKGPGRIDGNFVMSWESEDGSVVTGTTKTRYQLPTEEVLPGVHFREILIDIDPREKGLAQHERIVLFTPERLKDITDVNMSSTVSLNAAAAE